VIVRPMADSKIVEGSGTDVETAVAVSVPAFLTIVVATSLSPKAPSQTRQGLDWVTRAFVCRSTGSGPSNFLPGYLLG